MKRQSQALLSVIFILSLGFSLLLTSCPIPSDLSSLVPKTEELTLQKDGIKLDSGNKVITMKFSSEMTNADKSKIHLYNNDIKVDPSLYEISQSLDELIIALPSEAMPGDKYRVEFEEKALVGRYGSTNSNSSYEVSRLAAKIVISEIAVNKKEKTISLTFNTELSARDDSKFVVLKNGSTLDSVKYSIDWKESGVPGNTLVITFSEVIGTTDIFNVRFQNAALYDASTIPLANPEFESGNIDTTAPGLQTDGNLILDENNKILTVVFNTAISSLDASQFMVYKLAVAEVGDGSIVSNTNYNSPVLSEDKRSAQIVFDSAYALSEGEQFRVEIQQDAIIARYGISNELQSTELKKVGGIPVLVSKNLSYKDSVLSASFDKNLSSIDAGKVEVYKTSAGSTENKLALTSDFTAAIRIDDTRIVDITLENTPADGDSYRVKFLADAVSNENGRSNAEEVTNSWTFSLALIAIENIVVNKSLNTIILTLDTSLSAKNDSLIEVSRNGFVENQNRYVVDWLNRGIPAKVLVFTFNQSMGATDIFNIKFSDSALTDQSTPALGSKAFESGNIVTNAPGLKAGGDSLLIDMDTNKLTVSLSSAVTALDASKVSVYQLSIQELNEGSLVPATEYSSPVLSTDKQSIEIIFDSTLPENTQYRVRLDAKALTGLYNITSEDQSTEFDRTPFFPPALVTQDMFINENTLRLSFDKSLQSVDSSKVEVYKTPVGGTQAKISSTDYSVSIPESESKHLNITLSFNPVKDETYRVKILADGVTDLNSMSNLNLETLPTTIALKGGLILKNTAASSTRWSARKDFTSVVFNDRIWVMGGHDGSKALNDVWSSADGVTWQEHITSNIWSARFNHSSVVFNDKIWVIAGFESSYAQPKDVWNSSDGENWTKVSSIIVSMGSDKILSFVYDSKIWIINDSNIYRSSDGISWTKVSNPKLTGNSNIWFGVDYSSILTFDSKIWELGGYDPFGTQNRVWTSTDGYQWTDAKPTSVWTSRYNHYSVEFNGKLWVIGGQYKSSKSRDDMWSTSDGKIWTQEESTLPWSARTRGQAVSFDGKIWILGGTDFSSGNLLNEIWNYDWR